MRTRQFVGAAGAVALGGIIVGVVMAGPVVRAGNDDGDEAKVRIGLQVAPVELNLHGKNRALVGMGSYIVNVVGDCDGCHSAGPATQFLPGANPYFIGQTATINPATYLGGGRDFAVTGPNGTFHVVSRNLTPDHTGRPIGGDTFDEFVHTLRTGIDPDQVHPQLPAPFDGTLLQVMPWPALGKMTDRDLRAIYEYLSAIPCIEGPDHEC
jgi:hypothetical protein